MWIYIYETTTGDLLLRPNTVDAPPNAHYIGKTNIALFDNDGNIVREYVLEKSDATSN